MLATVVQGIQLAFTLVALAAAVYGITQLGKKRPADDDRILSGATRGSSIPLVIGKARVPGYVFWQQPQPPRAVSSGNGGKFGSNAGSTTFYEENFSHILGINVDKLYSIEEDDEVIFDGPITPLSHPSGTQVNLGDRGVFEIFWGEIDQPIPSGSRNARFTNADNTDFENSAGVAGQLLATRCSGPARIDWIPKNLGGRQTHPRMTYTVGGTVRSQLSTSQAHIPEGYDNTIPRLWGTAPDQIANAQLGGNYERSGGRVFFEAYGPNDELAFRVIRAIGGSDPRTRYVDISSGRPYETDNIAGTTLAGTPCNALLASFFAPGTIIRLQDGTADPANLAEGPYISPAGNALRDFLGGVLPASNFEYFYVQRVQFFSSNLLATTANSPNTRNLQSTANYQAIWQGFVRVWIGPVVDQAAIPFFTPVASIPAATEFFQAVPLVQIADDGVNPAHMIDQLMFAGWPYGASCDRKFYDIESLEKIGRQLQIQGEGYRGAIQLDDFTSAKQAIQDLMEDLSLIITFDPVRGKRIFELIREPDIGDVVEIPEDVITKGAPHTRSVVRQRTRHQLFTFTDQTRNFRDMPIVIDDDGARRIEERADLTKREIKTTRNPQTAFQVAERRGRAEQVTPLRFDFEGTRGCRDLRTGHILEVANFDRLLRVVSVKRDVYTDQVKIKAAVDAYGFQVDGVVYPEGRGERTGNSPTFVSLPGGPEGGSGPTFGTGGGHGVGEPPPALWRLWEAPAVLTPATGRMALLKNRVTDSANGTNIWISGDDVEFRVTAKDPFFQVAGFYAGDGGTPGDILLNVNGPTSDLSLLINLTTQDWNAGRQFLVIGGEVAFVKGWTALGGNNFRAVAADLQRGAWSTSTAAPAIGDVVFVVRMERLSLFDDVLLSPGAQVYFKAQNVRRGGSVGRELAEIESLAHTVGLGGKTRVDSALIGSLGDLTSALQGLGLLE